MSLALKQKCLIPPGSFEFPPRAPPQDSPLPRHPHSSVPSIPSLRSYRFNKPASSKSYWDCLRECKEKTQG